jgi:inositol-5-monophosphate dehydrogenase
MDKRDIQLFDNQEIRSAWDVDTEQWYFSIVDVVRVLTDQPNQEAARNYWKSLKSRIKDESGQPGTKRTQLKMKAEDGKMRLTDVVNTKELLRLVQSIPSPKAEPFKRWLAEVGNERIDEAQNPELAINRAMMHYRTLGYDENWINARLQSIQFRKELTDEWKRTGVKEGKEYALLTGIMMKGWSGKTVKEYKQFKGLKKENLRDNMTSLELALNILAETTATELSKTNNPDGLDGQKDVANRSGEIALDARKNIEKQTGHSVISPRNAKDLRIGGGNE